MSWLARLGKDFGRQAESRRAALTTGALGLLLIAIYYSMLFRQGPLYSMGYVALAMLFLATFLRIEIGIGALILAMLLSPEINLASLPLRMLTLRLEDVLIPTIVAAWLARAALLGRRQRLRLPAVLFPLAAWTVIALSSSLIGADEGRVDLGSALLYTAKQLEYFGVFLLTTQYVESWKRLRLVVILALFTCLALALYNFSRLRTTEVWTSNRITAPFEGATPEPSSIGGYFALMMALLIALLLYAPRGKRWPMLLALACVLPPFLLTLSRTSYVAFFFMLVLLAVLTRNRKLIVLLLVALLLSPFVMPKRVIDRVTYTFTDRIKVFGIFDRSFGERIYIWTKVSWHLGQRPWIGGGVTHLDIIDSSYARLLVETGVLGTIAYLTALMMLLRIGWLLHRRAEQWWLRGLALGYSIGLPGLMVHAATAVTFNIVRIMEPFWLVSGAVVAGHMLLEQGESSAEVEGESL